MARKSAMVREILEKPTINAEEFRSCLGVSRGTFNKAKKEKRIPAPIFQGPRSNRWSSQQVKDWLNGGAV